MFGCSAGEVLGTSIDRFIPAGLREVHRTHIHNFGTTNVINRRVNKLGVIKGLRANGEEFPIEAAISQLETAGEKVYTIMLRDITEQLHAEEQILLLNAELEQRVVARTAELLAAINDLEAFSYSVSHDLRAPLRAIDGFTRILLEEYASTFPEEAQHYFQRVRDNTQQMGQLIDDLLAFSRLSRQPLMKRSVDMAALIHQCLAELQPEQEGRQVAIHITELPNCQGDAALLKQVWTNLLTNALKYTRQRDSALITIDYQTDGAVMIYFIRDNGVGFDMRYSDKLFGVFQRLHRSADYEGTGVGLAIVQRIIQRHGGRIWAAAIPDQGATFFFTLEELPQ
jgi:PAS domain S-box-containing protein